MYWAQDYIFRYSLIDSSLYKLIINFGICLGGKTNNQEKNVKSITGFETFVKS